MQKFLTYSWDTFHFVEGVIEVLEESINPYCS
jgi:hypothetical protein